VEQRLIFESDGDRDRMLALFTHCLPILRRRSYSAAKVYGEKKRGVKMGAGLVDLLCYCLMDNHIHLLLQENVENGISMYMQRLLNSYARYFNVRHQRVGSLFAGPFKAVSIDGDEQLLHVSRYIHLNPYVAGVVGDVVSYRWSSLSEYLARPNRNDTCHTQLLKSLMGPQQYRVFVTNEADFARELSDINHLLLEEYGD